MVYIYGDILIAENIIMNLIIIWLTAYLTKLKTNIIKMLIGSIIGAIYAILIYLPSIEILKGISLKLALSVIVIFVVFSPGKLRDFIKSFTIFYLTSFLFGGIAFALIFMFNNKINPKQVINLSDVTITLLLVTCVIGYFINKISFEYIQKRISKESLINKINISIDGKEKEAIGLFDTANFLKDPISKSPVIVVEYKLVEDILPLEIKDIFINHQEKDIEKVSLSVSYSEWITKFRIIPYSSLGEDNGFLIGFKTDKISIFEKEHNIEIFNVIMAVYNQNLSNDGEYNALLHPEILNI